MQTDPLELRVGEEDVGYSALGGLYRPGYNGEMAAADDALACDGGGGQGNLETAAMSAAYELGYGGGSVASFGARSVRRRAARGPLGGFTPLLSSEAPDQGRIRGAKWTVSCIAQLYCGKASGARAVGRWTASGVHPRVLPSNGQEESRLDLQCLPSYQIISDAVSDRDANPRIGLCEFTYEWHLTR